MPSGILGQSDLAAATQTILYTVPATKVASMAVNFCNRNGSPVSVRLAVAAGSTASASEWILYDVIIPGNGALEKTALVVNAGENIIVYASATGVSVSAYGYEE